MTAAINDPKAVIAPFAMPRPGYLTPLVEPGFGTKLTRICGEFGAPIAGLPGSAWGLDARHHYSKDPVWSCDGKLMWIENKGTPSKLILDGETYAPVRGNVGNFRSCYESRWHPMQPTQMIGYVKSTRELIVFDALTDKLIKRISVPFVWQSPNGGFMSEGNVSRDGSMVAFGDEANNVCLVDIANGRVGPMQKVKFGREPMTGLDNITVSPLSTPHMGYVVCHGSDFVRVYDYGDDLSLIPHFESDLKLSHADVGVTPDGREVFVGGARAWYGAASAFTKDYGHVAAIFLDDGKILQVDAGSAFGKKESGDQHCSCRGPAGWVLTTFASWVEMNGQGQFCDEMVMWKLDGSRECVRFGITRTDDQAEPKYRHEAHGCPSPDGTKVCFASNWITHGTGGTVGDVKSYVVALGGTIDPPPPPPTIERFTVTSGSYEPAGVVVDGAINRIVPLAEIASLLNKAKW